MSLRELPCSREMFKAFVGQLFLLCFWEGIYYKKKNQETLRKAGNYMEK